MRKGAQRNANADITEALSYLSTFVMQLEGHLKDTNITEGKTEVPAIVIDVVGDHYLAKLPGSPLNASLFKDVLPSKKNHNSALQLAVRTGRY